MAIKGSQSYEYYRYNGPDISIQGKKGNPETLHTGMSFGWRFSSDYNSKRTIIAGYPSKVMTLPEPVLNNLLRQSTKYIRSYIPTTWDCDDTKLVTHKPQ